MQHVYIQQLKFQLSVPSETVGSEVEMLLKNNFQNIFEKVIDELYPADSKEIIKIEELYLDLGVLPINNFNETLYNALLEQLEKIFHHNSGSQLKRVEHSENQKNAFSFFLENGYFPWWFPIHNISVNQLIEYLLNEKMITLTYLENLFFTANSAVFQRFINILPLSVLTSFFEELYKRQPVKFEAFNLKFQKYAKKHSANFYSKQLFHHIFKEIFHYKQSKGVYPEIEQLPKIISENKKILKNDFSQIFQTKELKYQQIAYFGLQRKYLFLNNFRVKRTKSFLEPKIREGKFWLELFLYQLEMGEVPNFALSEFTFLKKNIKNQNFITDNELFINEAKKFTVFFADLLKYEITKNISVIEQIINILDNEDIKKLYYFQSSSSSQNWYKFLELLSQKNNINLQLIKKLHSQIFYFEFYKKNFDKENITSFLNLPFFRKEALFLLKNIEKYPHSFIVENVDIKECVVNILNSQSTEIQIINKRNEIQNTQLILNTFFEVLEKNLKNLSILENYFGVFTKEKNTRNLFDFYFPKVLNFFKLKTDEKFFNQFTTLFTSEKFLENTFYLLTEKQQNTIIELIFQNSFTVIKQTISMIYNDKELQSYFSVNKKKLATELRKGLLLSYEAINTKKIEIPKLLGKLLLFFMGIEDLNNVEKVELENIEISNNQPYYYKKVLQYVILKKEKKYRKTKEIEESYITKNVYKTLDNHTDILTKYNFINNIMRGVQKVDLFLLPTEFLLDFLEYYLYYQTYPLWAKRFAENFEKVYLQRSQNQQLISEIFRHLTLRNPQKLEEIILNIIENEVIVLNIIQHFPAEIHNILVQLLWKEKKDELFEIVSETLYFFQDFSERKYSSHQLIFLVIHFFTKSKISFTQAQKIELVAHILAAYAKLQTTTLEYIIKSIFSSQTHTLSYVQLLKTDLFQKEQQRLEHFVTQRQSATNIFSSPIYNDETIELYSFYNDQISNIEDFKILLNKISNEKDFFDSIALKFGDTFIFQIITTTVLKNSLPDWSENLLKIYKENFQIFDTSKIIENILFYLKNNHLEEFKNFIIPFFLNPFFQQNLLEKQTFEIRKLLEQTIFGAQNETIELFTTELIKILASLFPHKTVENLQYFVSKAKFNSITKPTVKNTEYLYFLILQKIAIFLSVRFQYLVDVISNNSLIKNIIDNNYILQNSLKNSFDNHILLNNYPVLFKEETYIEKSFLTKQIFYNYLLFNSLSDFYSVSPTDLNNFTKEIISKNENEIKEELRKLLSNRKIVILSENSFYNTLIYKLLSWIFNFPVSFIENLANSSFEFLNLMNIKFTKNSPFQLIINLLVHQYLPKSNLWKGEDNFVKHYFNYIVLYSNYEGSINTFLIKYFSDLVLKNKMLETPKVTVIVENYYFHKTSLLEAISAIFYLFKNEIQFHFQQILKSELLKVFFEFKIQSIFSNEKVLTNFISQNFNNETIKTLSINLLFISKIENFSSIKKSSTETISKENVENIISQTISNENVEKNISETISNEIVENNISETVDNVIFDKDISQPLTNENVENLISETINNEIVVKSISETIQNENLEYLISETINNEIVVKGISETTQNENLENLISETINNEIVVKSNSQTIQNENVENLVSETILNEIVVNDISQTIQNENIKNLIKETIKNEIVENDFSQTTQNENVKNLISETIRNEIVENDISQITQNENVENLISETIRNEIVEKDISQTSTNDKVRKTSSKTTDNENIVEDSSQTINNEIVENNISQTILNDNNKNNISETFNKEEVGKINKETEIFDSTEKNYLLQISDTEISVEHQIDTLIYYLKTSKISWWSFFKQPSDFLAYITKNFTFRNELFVFSIMKHLEDNFLKKQFFRLVPLEIIYEIFLTYAKKFNKLDVFFTLNSLFLIIKKYLPTDKANLLYYTIFDLKYMFFGNSYSFNMISISKNILDFVVEKFQLAPKNIVEILSEFENSKSAIFQQILLNKKNVTQNSEDNILIDNEINENDKFQNFVEKDEKSEINFQNSISNSLDDNDLKTSSIKILIPEQDSINESTSLKEKNISKIEKNSNKIEVENEIFSEKNEITKLHEETNSKLLNNRDKDLQIVENKNVDNENFPPLSQLIDDKQLLDFLGVKTKEEVYERMLWEQIDWIDGTKDDEKIYIKNSGIVLLWPFFGHLFKRLNYFNEKGKFASPETRERAAHLLQFIATGKSEAEEHELVLNKILLSIPIFEVIANGLELTEEEKTEAEKMMKAAISYWTIIKSSSVAALRENFLKRDGMLFKKDRNWNLYVERKAIDALLTKLPWGYGTIKLSWNKYLIYVDWN